MTFPVVEATNESSTNTAGTSHIVNLPSGIQSGDLLIVLMAIGSTAATINALAGWSEVLDASVANDLKILVRQADGTEGATVTFTSSASTRSAEITYRISSAQLLATQAPQVNTVATGADISPNPGTLTPTGGAKDYLWLAVFAGSGEEADDDTWVNSAPTNFTSLHQKACGTAGTNLGGLIASAQFDSHVASLDPDTFNKDLATAWRAYTIAVHPNPAQPLVGACEAVAENAGVLDLALPLSGSSDAVAEHAGDLSIDSAGPNVLATRTSQDTTGVTNHTVTLPDGSNVSGRRVIVWFSAESSVSWPDGWTQLVAGSTTSTVLAVAERIIDGTEGFDGTDDTITVTTSIASQSNAHAYLIDGAHASTPSEAATPAVGNDNNPDPPSLNPAGWDVEATLWLAGAASRFATTYSAAPTDYTDLLALNGGDDNAPLGTARRSLTAASDDPGTFTAVDGANWVATTVAVRPAGAGGAVDLVGVSSAIAEHSGALDLALALSGASESVAEHAGAAGLALPIDGVSNAVAEHAGTLGLALPLTSSSDAVAEHSGALAVALPLAGTSDAVAEYVGDLSVSGAAIVPLDGAVEIVAEHSGALSLALPLAGATEAVAEHAGVANLAIGLVGQSDTVAEHSGTSILAIGLTGDSSAVAEHSGSAILAIALQGAADAVAELEADMTLQGQVSLEAALDIVADHTGSLSVAVTLVGSSDAVAEHSGDLLITRNAIGVSQAVAEFTGALTLAVGLSGVSDEVAEHVGSLIMSLVLAGVSSAIAEHRGSLDSIPATFIGIDLGDITHRSWLGSTQRLSRASLVAGRNSNLGTFGSRSDLGEGS